MTIPVDNMTIARENKMLEVKNSQYQHNGSGTAIILRKEFNYRQARNIFNNHKNVALIIQNKDR